jgi:hypothetical protein
VIIRIVYIEHPEEFTKKEVKAFMNGRRYEFNI